MGCAHIERDQGRRGATAIFVMVSIFVIFGFAVLSIDVGMLALTRTQLQTAADAAALAGVLGYGESGGDSDVASAAAIDIAGANMAYVASAGPIGNTLSSVAISAGDVTFPEENQVQVVTHRTQATSDPLRTYFLRALDFDSDGETSITATAIAQFEWICGAGCIKPWSPPDRWFDADGDGTYNPDSLTNPGEYYDPVTTGYNAPADVGFQITLHLANGNNDGFGQSWYYSVNYPPINKGNPMTGGNVYRDWITGCVDPTIMVEPGDTLRIEPGMMVGPTRQGVAELIALDPNAQWDAASGTVINSAYPTSPRIIKACLFDPNVGVVHPTGGPGHVVVIKILALFIEQLQGNSTLIGRFMQTTTPEGSSGACSDQDTPTFLYGAKLVG